MLAGIIVIGADTGATKELIHDGENGYLYKSHDADSFINKLHKIVENQEEALLCADRGQKCAVKEFSLEHEMEQVIELYDKLAIHS